MLLYRQLTAFLFFAVFFAQTFNSIIEIADYYVHTAKYAENCINKARPMLHCNGKCQLMKRLQQEQKKDQENPERRADNKNEITLSSNTCIPVLPTVIISDIIKENLFPFSYGKSIDRSFDIFHPPQAS